ncbi:MAG TPA: glycosyltransferase family 4 protein [Azospirillum sp.]
MIYIVSPGGTREKGGMGRIVDNFTSDLARNNPEVRFAVIDTYGPDARFRRMPFYFLLAMLRLCGCFLLGRARLVHVHMAEYGSVVRKGAVVVLAALFRVPVVLHLHAGRFPEQVRTSPPALRWAITRLIGLASEIVVLGEYWRGFVMETFGDSARRVTVLHNAVPGPDRAPERNGEGPVHILFLGRLVKLKGINVLLDALASDACRGRPWRLTIAGDGDLDTYRAQAEALGLAGRVTFTGWLDQPACRGLLAEADVLVQPSMYEGLPMAVLEAMAHGLAIIATPVGSVPDAIEDGRSGLFVPPGDAAALAGALTRVIDDAGLRQTLAAGARERFARNFDIAVYRERLLEIYRRNGWTDGAPPVPAKPLKNATERTAP